MTGWLLDTNVLSELRRPKPEARVVAFVSAQPLDLLYVSAVTFAEIRFGIGLVEDGRKVRHTYSQPDLIIAATALHHGLTVVTRDTRDYERARVAVHNPWN